VTAYRAALQEYARAVAARLGGHPEQPRLEEAVTAYRAALQEWRRELVPLQWATTQNNLGNALRKLGARESGTARLGKAVTAYRAALPRPGAHLVGEFLHPTVKHWRISPS
jgi:hypothetical protein